MKIQVDEQVDRRQWDELVCRLGGTIFHSSAWAEYIVAAQPNAAPVYVRFLSDPGDVVGAALAFKIASPNRLLAPLSRRLWTESAPAMGQGDGESQKEAARLLRDYARAKGFVSVGIGCYASDSAGADLGDLGFRCERFWEFVLDLQVSEDQLWAGMDYKRRKNIKKAGRLQVTIRDATNEEGIRELRRLQGHSSQRIAARGGPDITYKGNLSRDPVTTLLASPIGRIVCAEVDGQTVSASLFTFFNGLVYHTLSGHSLAALESQAPTFLLWEMIRRFKAEGVQRFNFGGCSAEAETDGHPEHGVYVYKLGFGGRKVDCRSFDSVLRPMAARCMAWLRALRKGRMRSQGTNNPPSPVAKVEST